jgi:hypothetical protein
MKITAMHVRGNRRSDWRFVACLLLIAFTLQSYITQTHIHDVRFSPISKILAGSNDKSPINNTPTDCPLCQAVAHDGPFFVPAIALLLLTTVLIRLVTRPPRAGTNADVPVHSWQCRAPPCH